VRAPLRMRKDDIDSFVAKHVAWIERKQSQMKQKTTYSPGHVYASGERFWYLGEQYPLKISHTAVQPLVFKGHFILARTALLQARSVFEAWYRQQARQILTERVEAYARKMGLVYNKIRITSARTRWGSCSSQRTLSFPWRLVMAPTDVINYVVVHELIHLRVRNHAKAFWDGVESVMPDYREKRAWLKTNGSKLTLDEC